MNAQGTYIEVDLGDGYGPWVGTIGARMFDVWSQREYIIKKALDPHLWDDERKMYMPCRANEEGAIFQKLLVDDGTQSGKILTYGSACLRDMSFEWRKPPLKFLTYNEMKNLPTPEWLVEGLIMEKSSALLFGKSNAFKSFLGVDIACSVATGHVHDGWHGQNIADGYDVLYVATEGALGVATQRIPGWMEAHNVPPDQRDGIYLYPEEIALDDENAVNDLLATCAHKNAVVDDNPDLRDPHLSYRLIVIDIFGSTMMGPETSDETARAWVKNVNRIMREVGCAVLTLAHTGWADDTRARMHTHFWGSFDTRLKAIGDKDSRTCVLTVDRHKDADSAGEWGFRLDTVELGYGKTTLVPRLCDEVEAKQKRRVSGKPAVALQALSEALIDKGKTIAGPNYPTCPVVAIEEWKAMCQRHGLTDSDKPDAFRQAFNRAKTTLIEKALVRQFDAYVWKVQTDG